MATAWPRGFSCALGLLTEHEVHAIEVSVHDELLAGVTEDELRAYTMARAMPASPVPTAWRMTRYYGVPRERAMDVADILDHCRDWAEQFVDRD
jgi:hypothetical protein